MKDEVLTITSTRFKATCLAVFRGLETRRYKRVVVTRRGRSIAELTPPRTPPPSLWGALRSSVSIPAGVDVSAPTVEEPGDAGRGLLHR
ncbi:MAG: type II toxin-antitoxin system Phd/YefM family antitoxin [Pseudomonadota bacterium]